MTEYLSIIKSYWWLIASIIGWVISIAIGYRSYRQQGDEYLDRQRNRFFWRWFGIGAAVSLLIYLSSNPPNQEGTDHKSPLDRDTD